MKASGSARAALEHDQECGSWFGFECVEKGGEGYSWKRGLRERWLVGSGRCGDGREVTDLDDASGSIVDGVGAIASQEASMALWWIGVDWDGGGGGAGTMAGRRPRIYTRGRRRGHLSVAIVHIWF